MERGPWGFGSGGRGLLRGFPTRWKFILGPFYLLHSPGFFRNAVGVKCHCPVDPGRRGPLLFKFFVLLFSLVGLPHFFFKFRGKLFFLVPVEWGEGTEGISIPKSQRRIGSQF